MGGGRDIIRMGDRIGMLAGSHQTCNVRHVDHQASTDLTSNGTKPFEIDNARVGAGTGDDELGLVLFGELFQLRVVDLLAVTVDAVCDDVVETPREIHRGAVG